MNVKLSEAQKKKEIDSAQSLVPVMQQVLMRENKFGRNQEHFWVIGLNNANKILFVELLSLGRNNRANVQVPDALRLAIHKLSNKVIFVHNHPSGNLQPSAADKNLTDHMVKAADFLSIRVQDHIIISETSHFSFLDNGLMDEIRQSDTWRLLAKEDLRDMERKVEIARKEKEIEFAQRLIEKGMNDEGIKELSGLTIAAIRKLRK